LVLENGKVFKGKRFGQSGDVTAELVFTTGMTGYLETLTDKTYGGQIVVQTFPLIGNYGVIPADFEGDKIGPAGYIVKEWCQIPSNFRSEGNLDTFFMDRGVVALSGIDTRALTKMIRDAGGLNGCITDNPESVDLAALKAYRVEGQVAKMSVKVPHTVGPDALGAPHKVALLDCGTKDSIWRELVRRGCTVTLFPHDTAAEDILATKPDGLVISSGPGAPTEDKGLIQTVKTLSESGVPMLGIGLGHQLIALAHGMETTKPPYGHRGSNQPVKNLETGKVYITGQSHQYVVKAESIGDQAKVLYTHVNDGSPEGLRYVGKPIFSVQFHPESGPKDTNFLFDDFISMMGGQDTCR